MAKKVEAKEEEIPTIDMTKEAKPQVKTESDKIRITLPVRLKIQQKVYYPNHPYTVTKAQAETMREMVNKKRRADLSIFTGNNYLVQRLLDNTLVVKQVEDLNIEKIVRG